MTLRNLMVGLLMALVAFGLAPAANAAAPLKKFSIDITNNFLTPGSSVNLDLIIKNETPNGNSSINSLTVQLPTGYTVNGTPTANWNGQITKTTTTVSMSNMSPLKPLQSFTLTIPILVPSSADCTPSKWLAQAWTGSSFSGDQFTQKFVVPDTQFPVNSTTEVFSDPASSFTLEPANTTIAAAQSVKVKLTACTSSPVQGIQVTINIPGCTGACLTGSTTQATTDGSGTATFSVKVNSVGTYSITATASGFPDATSKSFSVFDGTLDCGDPIEAKFINPANLAPDQPGYAEGKRNPYNKDGVAEECVPVLYTFTNKILTDDTVNLTWDTSSQPNAAYEYTLNWQSQPVEPSGNDSGWPITLRPSVAWLDADGSETTGLSANPAWVPGLACLSGKLPAPYGTLVNAVDNLATSTSLKVTGIASNPSVINPLTGTPYTQPVPGDPAIPAYPFPIVIANTVSGVQSTATERMLVTGETARSSSSGVWTITFTVQRGDGLMPRAAHDAGYRVMSTPLPLIPTNDPTNFPAAGVYVPGTQAHMCIAAHGFTSYDFAGGIAHVLYKTRVFDIGDGWVRGF